MMITGGLMFLSLLINSSSGKNAVPYPAGTEAVSQSYTASESSVDTVDYYVLREYNGKIGIFIGDDTEPELIKNVRVSSLPEADRRLLAQGIQVSDRKELNRLIEDYCS